jgi:hypothetical protein
MSRLDTHRHPRSAWGVLISVCLAAAGVVACGGGGDSGAGSDAGGASVSASSTSFASGPITGFGSVIVNGIRFDDSSSDVLDDDGVVRSRDELRLGVTVEVHGGDVTSDDRGSHGLARRIFFHSALVGPVGSVDAAGKSLQVLGQTVDVTQATVFDDSLPAGLASIHAGDVVQVHALRDAANGHYVATRVQPRKDATFYKVRGPVSSLDTAARTLRIGSQAISYAGVPREAFPALADGSVVSVKLQTAPVQGVWQATQLAVVTTHAESHRLAVVRGRISAIASPSRFVVDGITVDTSGVAWSAVVGAEVKVKGAMAGGVLVAQEIESEDRGGRGQGAGQEAFELHGAITAFDPVAKTFTLRGVTVDFSASSLRFKDGSLGDLAVQRQVEVKGALSANGTRLVAATIDFEDR